LGNGSVTLKYSASQNGTYSTTKPTNAGTYWTKATIGATTNYKGADTPAVSFKINKAPITPTLKGTNEPIMILLYPQPNVNGNLGNGGVTYLYSKTKNGTYSPTMALPFLVGDYWVKAMISETANYSSATTEPISFSVWSLSFFWYVVSYY